MSRSEYQHVKDAVLSALEPELLPGAKERLADDIDRQQVDHLGVASAALKALSTESGRLMLKDAAGFDAKLEGAQGTEYLVSLLPIRPAARGEVFRQSALAVSGLPVDAAADVLSERLYKRENTSWHSSPPPAPPAERRTRALLEKLDPTLAGSADIETLAKRWSRDVHHMDDRTALETLAGRMVDRGLASSTNDPHAVVMELEQQSRQAFAAGDDSGLTAPHRHIPYSSLY